MGNVKQAAILIGGKGTRLGDAVTETPKPLLEVCGRPFVEHVICNLARFGFNDFLLLAGHKADVVRERYGEDCKLAQETGATIRVVVETSPLGTGGALLHAGEYLQAEFLLLNGDSIFDFNYLDLCLPGEDGGGLGRVALLPVEQASRYGFVELDGEHISAFREKPPAPESGLINSGVYWLRSAVLKEIDSGPCSLEQDVFPRLAAAGTLLGRTYRGYFIDIGIPEDLEEARRSLAEHLRKPAAFIDRDGTLNHDAGYTHKICDFRWMDGAREAIRALNDAGYLVFVVTNQAGIARGYYGPEAVENLHRWMQGDLAAIGAHIDDFRYCPHHPEGSVPALATTCNCRKPEPGMLLSLIEQWQPDLSGSFMLGDADKDALAGQRAGVAGVKLGGRSILATVVKLMDDAARKSN